MSRARLPGTHAPHPARVRRTASDDSKVDLRDVSELIRISNRLRNRSRAVQRAASQASDLLREVIRRSSEVCEK